MILIFGIKETKVYCKLNAWKYRARALMKNGLEDLKKSDWYLKKYRELEGSPLVIKGDSHFIKVDPTTTLL